MFFALVFAAALPTVSLPPRIGIAARARIVRGVRINLRNPAQKPVEAVISKGLIEFR